MLLYPYSNLITIYAAIKTLLYQLLIPDPMRLVIAQAFLFVLLIIAEAPLKPIYLGVAFESQYVGADPEMGNGNAGDDPNPPAADLTIGVDQGRYPIAKSYLLGLKFSF